MKELIDKITYLIGKKGKSVVTDKMFVNMLRDVYDFRYSPQLLAAINTVYDCNAIKQVLSCSKKKLENEVNKQTRIICKKYDKLEAKDVEKILYSFAIAYGIVSIEEYQNISTPSVTQNSEKKQNTSSNKKSSTDRSSGQKPDNNGNKAPSNPTSQKNKIDKVIIFHLSAYIITSVIGLVLLFVCFDAGWWPFFCIFMVLIGDFCYSIPFTNDMTVLRNITVERFPTFFAIGIAGVLKSFALLPIAFVLGGTFSFLLVALIIFAWVAFTVNIYQDRQSPKRKNNKWLVPMSKTLIGLLLLHASILFSGLFYHPIYDIQYPIRNIILKTIRSTKKVDLGYKNYKIGNMFPSSEMQKDSIPVLNQDTIVYGKKAICYSFADTLNGTSVDVSLLVIENKISKIDISIPFSAFDIEDVYAEKYGWPEIPMEYIEHDNFLDSKLSGFYISFEKEWTYPQGIIRICFDHIEYIGASFVELETLDKKRLKEAVEREKKQEEIEKENMQRALKKQQQQEEAEKEKENRRLQEQI